jgi:parallel beta-helix repeat protein
MRRRILLSTLALSACAVAFTAQPALAETACSRVAAPSGSDTAAGSVSAPYRTVQKLVDSLGAGQVGCLRGGTYNAGVKVSRGGTADAPIRLTAYGTEAARVVGRFWIATGADNVTVDNLILDGTGSPLPSPSIYASGATFADNEITNSHNAICVNIGQIDYGWQANGTTIVRNRIHGCGKLPAANHDHGIYVENAADTRIADNVIYDNADRGINLYPNARRTRITGNVITGNGQGILFSGDFGLATTDTLVEGNVIANSTLRYNVEAWFPAGNPTGSGNRVRRNCLYGGARGDIDGAVSAAGIALDGNVIADPALSSDLRVSSSSPCAALIAGAPLPAPTPSPTPTPAPSPSPSPSPTPAPTPTPAPKKKKKPGKPRALAAVQPGVALTATGRGRRVQARITLTGRRRAHAVLQIKRHGKWRNRAGRVVAPGTTARVSVRIARRASPRVAVRAKVAGVGVSRRVLVALR